MGTEWAIRHRNIDIEKLNDLLAVCLGLQDRYQHEQDAAVVLNMEPGVDLDQEGEGVATANTRFLEGEVTTSRCSSVWRHGFNPYNLAGVNLTSVVCVLGLTDQYCTLRPHQVVDCYTHLLTHTTNNYKTTIIVP